MRLVFKDTDKALNFVFAPEYRKEFLYTAKLFVWRQHRSEGLTFNRMLIPEVIQICTLWINWLF